MFALGFLAVWMVGGTTEIVADEKCGPLPEGAGYAVSPVFWPPGTSNCVVDLPGSPTRTSTYVPWLDFLVVALFAAAAALAVDAARRRRTFPSLWRALVVAVAAVATYFGLLPLGLALALVVLVSSLRSMTPLL